jgi:hypothetical protein
MPKDTKKNIDQYKISGRHLNEFELHTNQEGFGEQRSPGQSHLIPGSPPEQKAEHFREVFRKAHELAKKKQSTEVSVRGASAKKLAARKAAKKIAR